jgi:hypothetical protein
MQHHATSPQHLMNINNIHNNVLSMTEIFLPQHHTIYRYDIKKATNKLNVCHIYGTYKYILINKRVIELMTPRQLFVSEVVDTLHVVVVGRTNVDMEGEVKVRS